MSNKNIKSRKVRRSNIAKDKTVYQVVSKFRNKAYVLLFFGILMIFMKVNMLLIFTSLILMYVTMSLNDKLIFEVKENYLVAFIDKDYATVIYYDDIINYRFKKDAYSDVKLTILTTDEAEFEFILTDFKVIKSLDKLIGDKRVGK